MPFFVGGVDHDVYMGGVQVDVYDGGVLITSGGFNETAWTGTRATGLNQAGTALTGFTLGNAATLVLTSSEANNTGPARSESVTYRVTNAAGAFFDLTHNVTQAGRAVDVNRYGGFVNSGGAFGGTEGAGVSNNPAYTPATAPCNIASISQSRVVTTTFTTTGRLQRQVASCIAADGCSPNTISRNVGAPNSSRSTTASQVRTIPNPAYVPPTTVFVSRSPQEFSGGVRSETGTGPCTVDTSVGCGTTALLCTAQGFRVPILSFTAVFETGDLTTTDCIGNVTRVPQTNLFQPARTGVSGPLTSAGCVVQNYPNPTYVVPVACNTYTISLAPGATFGTARWANCGSTSSTTGSIPAGGEVVCSGSRPTVVFRTVVSGAGATCT